MGERGEEGWAGEGEEREGERKGKQRADDLTNNPALVRHQSKNKHRQTHRQTHKHTVRAGSRNTGCPEILGWEYIKKRF